MLVCMCGSRSVLDLYQYMQGESGGAPEDSAVMGVKFFFCFFVFLKFGVSPECSRKWVVK